MSKELVNSVTGTIFSDEDKKLIFDQLKSQIARNLTEGEFKMFLYICSSRNLNPLNREIYASNIGGKMTILTSIDGFRVIAERTKMYAPGKDTEFLTGDKGQLLGAKVYVKKKTADGTWHEVSATAFLHEYTTNQNLWKKMPSVMIEKCAEARALRRSFPESLAGLYSEDEMEQANNPKDHFKEIEQKEEKQPDRITDEKWEALDTFLNGYQKLREELKNLCKVHDLRYITTQQLDAVRKYAENWIKRNK